MLFVGVVWKCGSELDCEGVVCWCCLEMWIGTGVVRVFLLCCVEM
jgi:hypothetical protein